MTNGFLAPLVPSAWPEPLKRRLRPTRLAYRRGRARARTGWILRAERKGRSGGLPSKRVEIGSGGRPTQGYTHVDIDPSALDLHIYAPAHKIPLSDEWATEILSVHSIEHVPAAFIQSTLAEWYRILAPGGAIEIHTPNAQAIGRALSSGGSVPNRYWAAICGAFGYGLHPADAQAVADLWGEPEHRLLLDLASLSSLLTAAGFSDVIDSSGELACVHHVEWELLIPGFCLEITARKPLT